MKPTRNMSSELNVLHDYITNALCKLYSDDGFETSFREVNFLIRQLSRLGDYFHRSGYLYPMIKSPMGAYIKIILNWIDRNVPDSLRWSDNIDLPRLAKLCERYGVKWH